MKNKELQTTMQTPKIERIFLVTAVILSLPLIAMQFPTGVNWSLSDFIIMGILLVSTGLLYELGVKKISDQTQRYVFIFGLFFAALWLWAELAVGIFTNWGN